MASRRPSMFATPAPLRLPLPLPWQLAALGTVLCMYRPQQGGELGGWLRAVRAEAETGMDSDGPYESLSFFDGQAQCCWRLFLLPDSDFLAWDLLASELPAHRDEPGGQGVAERLWRRLAARLGGNGWRLCALRLHVLDRSEAGDGGLAASPALVSMPGVATARRIARQEGADGDVRLDDCCCARAAAAAAASAQVASQVPVQASAQVSPLGGSEVPLVRL